VADLSTMTPVEAERLRFSFILERLYTGDPAGAEQTAADGLVSARSADDPFWELAYLVELATIAVRSRAFADAARHFGAALELSARIRTKINLPDVLERAADVWVGVGRLADATVLTAASDTLREAQGAPAELLVADLDARRRNSLEDRLEPTARKDAESQGATMPLGVKSTSPAPP
jgi:hypothetical protein